MTNPEFPSKNSEASNCPKRPWVMMMFSDDEAVDREAVPPGLRFHLSRCPTCNALAEQLSAVTKSLSDFSDDQPAGDLLDGAQARVQSLLHGTPVLTGRVGIPDEPVMEEPMGRFRIGLPWFVGGSIAACLAVLLSGVWLFSGAVERSVLPGRTMESGWTNGHDDLGQYVWQKPVVDAVIEGPPVPVHSDFTEENVARVRERHVIYFQDAPANSEGLRQPTATKEPSSLQRSLDKPHQAVSTDGAAKDR